MGPEEPRGETPQYNPAAGFGPAPASPTPAVAAVGTRAPKSFRWLIPVVVIFVLLIALTLAVSSCTSTVVGALGLGSSSSAAITHESVAIITLDGEIAYDGSVCSPEGFKEMLDKAECDPLVKAVVLRVNSGGGTATAGEEMTTYLRDFSKPVVVSCAATNASAAYMISSQADYIYTAKSSAVGAIGVAMQLVDYSGLMQILGISTENIVSSDSKDSTYGTRGLSDEERAEYQHQVDQINEVFIDFVAEGRHMDKDKVRQLATGMTFTGTDSVSNGLADEIGTLEDACSKAAKLANMSSFDVVYLEQKSSGLQSLMGMTGSSTISIKDLASIYKELK